VSGSSGPWRAFRAAPGAVQLLLLVTVLLLLGSIVCVAGELATPGNAVVGTFGLSATVLGALVAGNVGNCADAVAGLARALRPGRRRPAEQSERGTRVFGVYYVIFGIVLAVAGYGGFIHWKR
jgi:hypothetical protein